MTEPTPAHLPYLRALCERGHAPVTWSGAGRDDSLPLSVAKRLENGGFIRRDGPHWVPTDRGLHAVGRAI